MRELLHDAAPPVRPPGRKPKYPFKSMQVGDSFIVAPEERHLVRNAAYRWRERHMPWMFVIGNDAEGNLRLWRIKGKAKHVKKAAL